MISALIISFYDHNYIEECIASLSFVDEIIVIGKIDPVVLSGIEHQNLVQFIESENLNFDFLLEKAHSKASHNWILGLEANHCISKQLAEEINEIIMNTDSTGNYKAKIRFKFMGKFLKFSGYRSSYTSLLVHKNSIKNKTTSKKLKYSIEELYLDFDRYSERQTIQAKQKAQQLYTKSKQPNLFHFLVKPLWKLKKIFLLKLGFLDGKEGFVFAYLNAFKEFKTYLFLWLMYRNIE
jgi:hypothetical protein